MPQISYDSNAPLTDAHVRTPAVYSTANAKSYHRLQIKLEIARLELETAKLKVEQRRRTRGRPPGSSVLVQSCQSRQPMLQQMVKIVRDVLPTDYFDNSSEVTAPVNCESSQTVKITQNLSTGSQFRYQIAEAPLNGNDEVQAVTPVNQSAVMLEKNRRTHVISVDVKDYEAQQYCQSPMGSVHSPLRCSEQLCDAVVPEQLYEFCSLREEFPTTCIVDYVNSAHQTRSTGASVATVANVTVYAPQVISDSTTFSSDAVIHEHSGLHPVTNSRYLHFEISADPVLPSVSAVDDDQLSNTAPLASSDVIHHHSTTAASPVTCGLPVNARESDGDLVADKDGSPRSRATTFNANDDASNSQVSVYDDEEEEWDQGADEDGYGNNNAELGETEDDDKNEENDGYSSDHCDASCATAGSRSAPPTSFLWFRNSVFSRPSPRTATNASVVADEVPITMSCGSVLLVNRRNTNLSVPYTVRQRHPMEYHQEYGSKDGTRNPQESLKVTF